MDKTFQSPANSKAEMVLTTLNYQGSPVRFVQFPAANGAPTRRDPKAFLVLDDDVLNSFDFRKHFRKLIKGLMALAMTDPVEDDGQEVFLHKEITILGQEVDIIPLSMLSYLAEYRAPADTALKAFTDFCFCMAWDLLTGQCPCRTYAELDTNGDHPRPKLARTAASDGVKTLEDAIQKIEQLAQEKTTIVSALENALRLAQAA
jgi:hypothetical protein